ncbi:sialidase family protein [Paraburkholderia dipogonis]|uniref:Sialidase family protein n=1 Tax=Paraburkholderia dipogonis TaxID=1211383 RepID=A0ABW9B618_9BURK
MNMIAAAALAFTAVLAFAAAPSSVEWIGITEIAEGRGEKGAWRQNDSRYDYVDDATVAFDSADGVKVAWVDQKKKDVFHQSLSADGTAQGRPVNVSRNPATFSWLPRMVVAPGDPGKIGLLWQEIIFSGGSHGGDILFARSTDGGASFSAPINLSNSRGGDGKGRLDRDTWSNGSLDLAMAPDGALLAAWTEYDGMLWLARSTDGGASFSRPVHVAGDGKRPARGPSLATGPGQTVYLAWTVGADRSADISVAQSDDGGQTFGRPHVVGASPGHADAPRLAAGRTGTLHLVYAESEDGPSGRYYVRYAQSIAGVGKFGIPQVISQPQRHAGNGAAYPAVAVDRQGTLHVAWELFQGASTRPLGLEFTVSRDDGHSFLPPQLVPGSQDERGGTNGSHQGLLGKKLAVGGDGRIAVVNTSMKLGGHSRVWLMLGRMNASGTAGPLGEDHPAYCIPCFTDESGTPPCEVSDGLDKPRKAPNPRHHVTARGPWCLNGRSSLHTGRPRSSSHFIKKRLPSI